MQFSRCAEIKALPGAGPPASLARETVSAFSPLPLLLAQLQKESREGGRNCRGRVQVEG